MNKIAQVCFTFPDYQMHFFCYDNFNEALKRLDILIIDYRKHLVNRDSKIAFSFVEDFQSNK